MISRTLPLALGSLLAAAAGAFAGPVSAFVDKSVAPPEEALPPLNVVDVDASYVGGSGIEFAHKEIGRGWEAHSALEYTRRIPIQGKWFLQLGASYDRYEFGGTSTRILPTTLQSFDFSVGLSYIFENHVGFLAEVRPGFHFEHRVTTGAFDIPFNIGGFLTIVDKKLYGVWGLGTSILREWPVIPTLGVVWVIRDDLRLMGYVPEPKLVYDLNKDVSIWLGGELIGGSYKVDSNVDRELSNTVLDYTEYRVGLGFTYNPAETWELNVAAGCAIDRTFDYHRANKSYSADPSPYVRVQFGGAF